jgi:hypothetical protein
MALGSFYEDIKDRWLEETSALHEARVRELIAQFPVPPPPAGEVFLTRRGRRMEDIEVCEVRQDMELAVVSTPHAAAPMIELEEGVSRRTIRPRASGGFQLTFRTAGLKQLRVSSAGFINAYSVHAVEPFRVEAQADFSQLIRTLTHNPPQWTEGTFALFRRDLEKVLDAHRVPQIFTDGIVEYHLGLLHEEQRRPAFRERFHAAYGNLRWFIPYSDIARLICTHYLYCANEFAAALKFCGVGTSRLQRTLCFFLGQDAPPARTVTAARADGQGGLPLLVALPDLLTYQAVDALQTGRADEAVELCSATRREIIPAFDRERADRLAYLEACCRKAAEGAEAAHALFENLSHSPWQLIAAAATRQLDHLAHG